MAAEKTGGYTGDDRFDELDEFTAREADNYVEAVRQREILRMSADIRDLFTDTKQAVERGELDNPGRQSVIRSAIEQFIIDIENIAMAVEANHLLDGTGKGAIYTVQLSPPEDLVALLGDDNVRIIGEPNLSRQDALRIRGLNDYLNAPEHITAKWTMQADLKGQQPQPVTQETVTLMPVDASQAVYQEIRKFLANVDLDLGPNLPDYMGDDGPGL